MKWGSWIVLGIAGALMWGGKPRDLVSAEGASAESPNDDETSPGLRALREGLSRGGTRAELEELLRDAKPLVQQNVLLTRRIEETLSRLSSTTDEKRGIKLLKGTIREGIEILEFEYVKEAELPVGFPEPTPVGEIRVKSYPAYRMAAVKQGMETFAFWTLFGHIKKNEIAMTAPVEMTFGKEGKKSEGMQQMAFLYGSQEIGKPGKDGQVEVVDVQPMLTVSIGMKGEAAERGKAEAKKFLEEWLKEHAKEHQPVGPLRMMGYNSPMVPSEKRYFEFEIPVKRLTESTEAP